MTNLLYGIMIGVLLAMGIVELFMKPIVIYECTQTEKVELITPSELSDLRDDLEVYKLAAHFTVEDLNMNTQRLRPAPKPEVKPR